MVACARGRVGPCPWLRSLVHLDYTLRSDVATRTTDPPSAVARAVPALCSAHGPPCMLPPHMLLTAASDPACNHSTQVRSKRQNLWRWAVGMNAHDKRHEPACLPTQDVQPPRPWLSRDPCALIAAVTKAGCCLHTRLVQALVSHHPMRQAWVRLPIQGPSTKCMFRSASRVAARTWPPNAPSLERIAPSRATISGAFVRVAR